MSNALAIAAVTAVLKDLLDNAVVDHSLNTAVAGSIEVSALAPDLVKTGAGEPPRLNLYLYRVTPNQGWRNMHLPSRNRRGERLSNPALALDLHYLLTSYGSEDFQAEILLGYAMQRLHENPVLTRNSIRASLAAVSPVDGTILPPAVGTLAAADLAEQMEMIKITPELLSGEELSKMWTAFQSNYRPSAAYVASVVLIESSLSTRSALPVLTRGAADSGVVVTPGMVPPYPAIQEILPPSMKPSAVLSDVITLRGHHLDGTGHRVICTHPRLSAPIEIVPSSVSPEEITFAIPNAPTAWLAGIYGVHISLTRNGTPRTTNETALALSPSITAPVGVSTAAGITTFTVSVAPEVEPSQRVTFIAGDREVAAEAITVKTNSLIFKMANVAPGSYYARLRIDGIESIFIKYDAVPPEFLNSQKVTVP